MMKLRWLFVLGLLLSGFAGLACADVTGPYGSYHWTTVSVPAFETLPSLLPDEKVVPGSGMINMNGRIIWVTTVQSGGKNINGFLLWDSNSGKVGRIDNWRYGRVLGLAYNASAHELLIRTSDAMLTVNPDSFEVTRQVAFAKISAWRDMAVVGGELAILSGNGSDILIHDPKTMTQLRTFSTGLEKIQRIGRLNERQLLLWSSYWGGSLRLSDLKSGTVSKGYRLHGSNGVKLLSKLVYGGENRLMLLDPFNSGVNELLQFTGSVFVAMNNGGQVTPNGLGWRIRPRVQRLEGQLTMLPSVDMPATELLLVLPVASTYHQELAEELFPEGGQVVIDKLGNRSLRISVPALKAGEQYNKSYYTARLTRYQTVFQLPGTAMPFDVPPEWNTYLSDRKVYDLEHPQIAATLQELVPAGATAADTVQAVYRFAVGIPYGKGFEAAPAAIVKRSGGCTEHSYIQVALLRKAGIPARFVWNSIGDRNGEAQFDHKFAEAWLPETGWVPLEPLAGSREHAGMLINYPLAFSVMDGPGRDYIANGDKLVSFSKPYYKYWKIARPAVIWKVGEKQKP